MIPGAQVIVLLPFQFPCSRDPHLVCIRDDSPQTPFSWCLTVTQENPADNSDQHRDIPSSPLPCPPCLICLSLIAQHTQSWRSHFLWPSTTVLEALASVPFPCYSFCLGCFGPSSCSSLPSKPSFLPIFWMSAPWLTSLHTDTSLCLSTDPLIFCCAPCCFVIIS